MNNSAIMLVSLALCISLAAISGLLALQRRVSEIGRAIRESRAKSTRSTTSLSSPEATLTIELTSELIETLAQIEKATGDPLDEVLAKAMALYKMSVEAHDEGKRIGVFDRNLELEREVVGFEHQASS
jgi:hypothetical protein